jgi:hypothetical protein
MMCKMLPLIVALAALSGACAGPGPGLTGNNTGGIIPWSPANKHFAFDMADAHCAQYGKLARVTSVYAQHGHYIGFACLYNPANIVRQHAYVLRSRS